MAQNNLQQMAREHGQAVLRMRAEALEGIEIARASGDRKEARAWQSHLQQLDKMIADYGLERYASRT